MNWLNLVYMLAETPLVCWIMWRKAPVTPANQPQSVTVLAQSVTPVTPLVTAKPLQFWTVALPDGSIETRCKDTETGAMWRLKSRGMERLNLPPPRQ